METINKKECPKCEGKNVIDTGNRRGDVIDYDPSKPIPEPIHPIYKCKDCKELFVLGG